MATFTGAILFPGQGSQENQMGRDLAEYWPEAMELWKLGEKISGLKLREVYWDGTEQDQAKTVYLQPALTVTNLALWFFLQNKLKPKAVTGHSLGEYSALIASKVWSVQDGLKLVSLRGKLMDEAGKSKPGAMAAILKLPLEELEKCVSKLEPNGIILIANYNTPSQYVVSGEEQLVDELIQTIKSNYKKVRAIKLAVSGGFHSPLLTEAARELSKAMEKISFSPPQVPIYFNLTARLEQNPDQIKKIMQKQMTSSVLWMQTISNMYQDNIKNYLEIGPKNVLSKMTAQILQDKPEVKVYKCAKLEECNNFVEVK